MNSFERTYLELSLTKLEEVLPLPKTVLMEQFETSEDDWSVEQINDLVFCLFGYPVLDVMEQLILLVYDDQNHR